MCPARDTADLCPWCSAVKVRSFRSAVGAAHDCFQWGPLGSDDAQVTRRHRSRKVSELSARSDRVAKRQQFCPAHVAAYMPVSNGFGSCVASLLLSCEKRSVQSSHPDGVSGATVAVRENNYPTILSFELESPYERDRACASLGRVETVATMLSIARQQTLRNCR